MEPLKIEIDETSLEYFNRVKGIVDIPISGGWGYSREDACRIDAPDSVTGVPVEYEFAWMVIQAEVFDSQFARYDCTSVEIVENSVRTIFGKISYDILTLEVLAQFGNEQVQYRREFWFDISNFWNE